MSYGNRQLLSSAHMNLYTGASDTFRPFAERTGLDQSGLGLGLSITRQTVRVHDGNILVRNTAGGCIFAID